jgi:hypothetical protein
MVCAKILAIGFHSLKRLIILRSGISWGNDESISMVNYYCNWCGAPRHLIQ